MSNFVHLHLHSGYSLLDSMIRIPELAEKLAEHKFPACAITDHGTLAGAVKFTQHLTKKGIKPIIGQEFYIAPDTRHRMKYAKGEHYSSHLILLAKNDVGWKNLMALSTRAHTEGFYRKPRIDHELLREHHEGLICTSACIGGDIAIHLKGGLDYEGDGKVEYDPNLAASKIAWYQNLFEDDFYLEIQSHDQVHDEIAQWYRDRYGSSQIVATADAHYLNAADCDTHDTLLCCGTYAAKNDPDRWRFPTDQCWVKTEDEMLGRFLTEEIENTLRVAEKCDFELPLNKGFHMPELPFDISEDNSVTVFKRECWSGLSASIWKRFGTICDESTGESDPFYEYRKRLDYEMDVFIKAGFVEYTLLLWDLMRFCKTSNIFTGDGRGSGAGSLVLFSLGITKVDPVERDCPFERFINAGRLERFAPPDVDLDFPQSRRSEVIQYLRDRYGDNQVCQIGTYATLGAAALIKKLRVPLGLDYGIVEKLCKLLPQNEQSLQGAGAAAEAFGLSLDEIYLQIDQFAEIINGMGELGKWLMHYARELANLGDHASKHASGVIVTNKPVMELLPLMTDNNDLPMAQFDMFDSEMLGLVKFDILGLKTLDVLEYVDRMIRTHDDPNFSFETVDLDEREPYDLLHVGRTSGIFQASGGGFGQLLPQIRPTSVEMLCALTSLCRPGPKISGLTDKYVKRVRGEEAVTYKIHQLEPILERNFGVMAYQEDIMAIANQLAGYSLAEADDLRKIVGKKQRDKMPTQREKFINGLESHSGISPNLGEELWQEIAAMAEYVFNRSHAMAYSYITAKCMWAKFHYPAYFLAATMTSEIQGDGKELPILLQDARYLKVNLKLPDINSSQKEYQALDKTTVQVGLLGIHAVGDKAVDAILEERAKGPFKSKDDFRNRIPAKKANKSVFEALENAGAFDVLEGRQRRITTGRLIEEFQLFGFFLSGHPCQLLRETWLKSNPSLVTISEVENNWEQVMTMVHTRYGKQRKLAFAEQTVRGVVTKLEKKKSKKANGSIMLFITLEDESGSTRMILNQTQLGKMGNPTITEGIVVEVVGHKADPNKYPGHFEAKSITTIHIVS